MIDAQEAESGQYNYLQRSAIGTVYQENQHYDRAIAQLRIAIELQPNDRKIHQALIECYDSTGDNAGAVRQLLEQIRLNPRVIELYTDLGRRLGHAEMKRQFPEGQERAYTSLVEMLPAESEGHAALAEIRQQQNRWEDAVKHWARVAEIRSKEPAGLMKLCAAQIHLDRLDDAKQSFEKLNSKIWPTRFDNLKNEIRQLGEQVDKLQ